MKLLVHDYEDELAGLAKSALEIKVLIAFLTEGGLRWLPEDKYPCAEFIVGIDLGITSPGALKSLQRLGARVKVFSEPGKMFHPKVVYFGFADTEVLIVGSNNLTSGGIASNHEVSLLIERNESSHGVFGDFLSTFERLKHHACCGVPGDRFFDTYKQSNIQRDLSVRLREQKPVTLERENVSWPAIGDANASTLRGFIQLLAREFPKLDRRSGGTLKDHPLKLVNDQEFRPRFQEIVSTVSKGRLKGASTLNIGGNWYLIPHILAVNEDREPWENTSGRGRLVAQIHFSKDFSKVLFSVVLHYSIPRSVVDGKMPDQVAQRFQKLLGHVEHSSDHASLDGPSFWQWDYKGSILWGKPVMTFEHAIESLPGEEALCADLAFLADEVNGASAVS